MNSIRFCFGVFICVFIFTLIATPNSANAKKIELFGSAVEITTCNSGSLASYYVSKGTSDKLFFYFLGGGAARSAADYIQQSSNLKKSIFVDGRKKTIKIDGGLEKIHELGYQVILVPSCSSDLYMGAHSQVIDDQVINFNGRSLTAEIASIFAKEISNAQEVVLAGTGAGAVAVSTSFTDFQSTSSKAEFRILIDGFWMDTQELTARVSLKSNHFIHKSVPSGCPNGLDCYPSRSRLKSLGVEDAFLIMNMGDLHRLATNDEITRKEFAQDVDYFGGGISVGYGFDLEGITGDHGILGAKSFYQEVDGIKLGDVILNWLKKEGKKTLLVQDRSAKIEQDIAPMITTNVNFNSDKSIAVISGDWDCDGHETLIKKLDSWDFEWVYINHCVDRLNMGAFKPTTQRIWYNGVTVDEEVTDILGVLEYIFNENHSKKVVVIGHAQGGSAVNALVDSGSLLRIAEQQNIPIEYAYEISGAVSYYPFCQTQRIPKRPTVPFLVELAGADTLDEPFVGCEENNSRKTNFLEINVYENAPHGFDKEAYSGSGVKNGRNKVGHKYLVKYDPVAAKKSYKRLEGFLNDLVLAD